jgi:2-C-methyl-D-erythritol 4-phosphate cytidylyltransferase
VRVTGILLAAGQGRRMGQGENKAFLRIGGTPLLSLALRPFLASSRIDDIVVVVGRDELERAAGLLRRSPREVEVVAGGDVRRDSAIAGVEAAAGDIVLIHDGARPFPSVSLIERVIDGAAAHGACVPVLPVVDTVRRVDEGSFLGAATLDRTALARMQTPQGFRRELIRRALAAAASDVPDDAAAVLALGWRVATTPGESTNVKITSPADLPLAEAIASTLPPST